MREFGRARTLALAIPLVVLLQLQPAAVRATEAAPESASTTETDSHWLSFLVGAGGGLGSYRNVTRQRGDPPSPLETGSDAFFIDVELGLEVFDLGISYHWGMIRSPGGTYIDDDDYGHGAGRYRHGIKAVYALRGDRLHLLPELGYVFLDEHALIHDVHSERADRYKEKYEDENYNYGLSARARIIPVLNAHWWLYARYVHDNLDIQVDNYQLELQLGDEYSESRGWVEEGINLKSGYFGLGVSWSKKTDGRSEWFITLGFTGTIRVL
jgi:hypothetical protein